MLKLDRLASSSSFSVSSSRIEREDSSMVCFFNDSWRIRFGGRKIKNKKDHADQLEESEEPLHVPAFTIQAGESEVS